MMIMNDEFRWMWKESILICLKELFEHFLYGLSKTMKNLSEMLASGWSAPGPPTYEAKGPITTAWPGI